MQENISINIQKVKIAVTIPRNSTQKLRDAICNAGAGIIGNYTYCSSSTKCLGTFIPNNNANPHIGKCNHLEFVEEDRLEVVCDIKNVKTVLKDLRDTHPYEEPVIDIIPLLDESLFI